MFSKLAAWCASVAWPAIHGFMNDVVHSEVEKLQPLAVAAVEKAVAEAPDILSDPHPTVAAATALKNLGSDLLAQGITATQASAMMAVNHAIAQAKGTA